MRVEAFDITSSGSTLVAAVYDRRLEYCPLCRLGELPPGLGGVPRAIIGSLEASGGVVDQLAQLPMKARERPNKKEASQHL